MKGLDDDVRKLENTISKAVCGVSFDPSGEILAAGGYGGFDIWDLRTSKRNAFIPSRPLTRLYGFKYDPLGFGIYVSDPRHGFRLIPLNGSLEDVVPGSPDNRHVVSFDLTRDGKHLVVSRGGAGTNRLECWNVSQSGGITAAWSLINGEPIDPEEPFLLNQAKCFTNAVGFAPDGDTFVTVECPSPTSADAGCVTVRKTSDGSKLSDLGQSETFYDVTIHMAPDGKSMYAWDNERMEQWDLNAGVLAKRIPSPGRSHFTGLVVHPVTGMIITISGDGKARTWDPGDLSLRNELKLGVGKLHSLAINSAGTAVAGGNKGEIALWEPTF